MVCCCAFCRYVAVLDAELQPQLLAQGQQLFQAECAGRPLEFRQASLADPETPCKAVLRELAAFAGGLQQDADLVCGADGLA